VIETLLHTQTVLKRCTLHAFVIMPNHVHVLATPAVPLPQLTKTIKSFTANQANRVLGRTGQPFWQNETYDHLVRDATSFEKIRHYIEHNPVRAGLVHLPADHKWSSSAASCFSHGIHPK